MKKNYIYLLLLLLIGHTSCNDYLEVDSPSAFDSEYVFSTEEDALKMIYSVYSCFPVDAFTSRMSNVFMMNTDVEIAEPSASPDGTRRDIWSLQPNYTFSDLKSCWNICYLAIDRANQCIKGIEASSLYKNGNTSMQQMLGEAYCLRAYWYFLLCNFWGDVPLALEPSEAGMDLNTPRVDKDSIYSILIKDLVNHEENMMWADKLTGGIERMNREFALGFITKLSLFRAGYSMQKDGTMKRKDDYLDYYATAKQYAQKLIQLKDRELNPSFKQVFLNECKFISPTNDDMLFEVAFVKDNGGDVGWCIGITVNGGNYGAGSTYINLNTQYYYSFDQKDLRLPVTCSLFAYKTYNSETSNFQFAVSPTTINPGKWCRAWLTSAPGSTTTKGTGINWPILRYSDVLLMLAEADNEINNGPTDLARNALKRVRNRAFATSDRAEKVENYVNALSSKDDFFNAIVNERAWEFGGECIRKFDLVRWNLYGKKIVALKKVLTDMGYSGRGVAGYETYNSLADIIYYQVNSSGTVSFLNTPYQRITDTPKTAEFVDGIASPEGSYYTMNWLKAFAATDTTAGTYVTRCWRGYTDATGESAVPYLLPINQEIVVSSDGVLSNDGYGLIAQ